MTRDPDAIRRRAGTALGWVAGGCLGLLVNYGLFAVIGEAWPLGPTTFVLFVAGAFGGMALSDRLGARALRPLGVAAGVLLGLVLLLAMARLFSPPG